MKKIVGFVVIILGVGGVYFAKAQEKATEAKVRVFCGGGIKSSGEFAAATINKQLESLQGAGETITEVSIPVLSTYGGAGEGGAVVCVRALLK